MTRLRSFRFVLMLGAAMFELSGVGFSQVSDASQPHVDLITESASPRAVENQTERTIIRDYGAAWEAMAEAFQQNSPGLLSGYFVDTAKSTLQSAVAEQKKIGISSHYLDQTHKLKVVFYAPEGDVMELYDHAEYTLQVVGADKTLHDERVSVEYMVLMTPAADRWVIRHLQSVANVAATSH